MLYGVVFHVPLPKIGLTRWGSPCYSLETPSLQQCRHEGRHPGTPRLDPQISTGIDRSAFIDKQEPLLPNNVAIVPHSTTVPYSITFQYFTCYPFRNHPYSSRFHSVCCVFHFQPVPLYHTVSCFLEDTCVHLGHWVEGKIMLSEHHE